MNIPILITLSVSTVILSLIAFCCIHIRRKYVEYDTMETKRESIERAKGLISQAKDYFRNNYDNSVWSNLQVKIDFCMKLISRRGIDDQITLLDRLFKTCYETGVRLKTNYDDVAYIISPLNNLKDELVQYHLTYIREAMEGL